MSPARILAIEDDPIHAEALRLCIEQAGYILIDVVDNIEEFKRLVVATVPDMLLMDIELGAEKDGVDLAAEVTDLHNVPFIFITSRQDLETTRRATDLRPSAYITKPINSGSLMAAVELAGKNVETPKVLTNGSQDFFIKSKKGFQRVDLDRLLFIEASNKQCVLHFNDGLEEITMKLGDLLKQLPARDFIQVHRSFVINFPKLNLIDPGFKFLTIDENKIPIGRNYRDLVLRRISQ